MKPLRCEWARGARASEESAVGEVLLAEQRAVVAWLARQRFACLRMFTWGQRRSQEFRKVPGKRAHAGGFLAGGESATRFGATCGHN